MILQFAKLPPPIGGISIHAKRLLESLEKLSIEADILDYSKKKKVINIIKKIYKSDVVHIHLSRKLHRLLFIIIFKIIGKKVITTFHGRYTFDNKYDRISLKLSNRSIVLNKFSFDNSTNFVNRTTLIGAFIPPLFIDKVSIKNETEQYIEKLKNKYGNVFCTNAWNVSFDENNSEIYNGSLLVDIFSKTSNSALVFSDPVGNYKSYLLKKYKQLPKNIFFITYSHDFIDIIKMTSALIRATTTDGDSLSVREALYFSKNVITSNVVDRPNGCIIYKTNEELESIINNYDTIKKPEIDSSYINNATLIIDEYKRLKK